MSTDLSPLFRALRPYAGQALGGSDHATPRARGAKRKGGASPAAPVRPVRPRLSELLMRHHRGAALRADGAAL